MKINYNVTGEQRKELVKAIGAILQVKPVYKKMPTCAYEIGDITVDNTSIGVGQTITITGKTLTAGNA